MNRKRDVRAFMIVILVMLAGLLYGLRDAARAMVPEDVLNLRTASPVDLSPDGKTLLYKLGVWDEGAWQNSMFLRDLDSGRDLLIFAPADKVLDAVWRPDGQAIAYRRSTDRGIEVWIMDRHGSDRRRLSNGTHSFGQLKWSPDGSALAWVHGVTDSGHEGKSGSWTVADGIGYRNLDKGYRRGARNQLFVMDLANLEPRRLVREDLDVRSFDWSPGSDRLVFAAKREKDLGWNLNEDLFTVARSGGEIHQLTTNPGGDQQPRWYRKNAIAYLRATDPIWESAPRTVTVVDPDTGESGEMRHYGAGFDHYFWKFAVHKGNFYVLGAIDGCLDLIRIGEDSHQIVTAGGRDYWSVEIESSRAVFSGTSMTLPGGIFMMDIDARAKGRAQPELILDPNADLLPLLELTEPEPFSVTVDGQPVHGWFFKPDHLEPGHRVPVVLSIHGGPEWMYGGYFLGEFHILPRFGYGVVIANPTGSMGYGTEFREAIRGDWLETPGKELMACLQLAVDRGWADPDRMAVMGGSYGGHLGAGLTTMTDRFRAAALDRMYPELVSFWGTTDEKWFPEWEFRGRPWDPDARDVYRRNSPFEKIDQVRTPTLVSHGMLDYRCLIAGAEIWFSGLQAQGVPSRLIRFENEGHGIRRPDNKAFYYDQLLTWFGRHVLNLDEPAAEEDLTREDNTQESTDR